MFNFFLFLQKLQVTSNASRKITKIKPFLNLGLKPGALYYRNGGRVGRLTNGRVACWTKSARKKTVRLPRLMKSYRYKLISFISNFSILPFSNKLISLVFYLTGGLAFIHTPDSAKLFGFLYFNTKAFYKNSIYLKPTFSELYKVKPMSRISLIETLPGYGIKYVKSSGCYGTLIKIDLNKHLVLVKLPSGVKKLFPLCAVVTYDKVSLKLKKKIVNTKSGFWRSFGIKPIVRGVARNPIDHPHGGRTKSIKYPRTPWGKTTKYK